MSGHPQIRPGGRSERIQLAVHAAVKALVVERSGQSPTVSEIADKAGVTPSTIYRRWGSLSELLAQVECERFLPDRELPDTGNLAGDLSEWLEQFVDDMATALGRDLYRERLADTALARLTAGYARSDLDVLVKRAVARYEYAPNADRLIDTLVAPIVYRLVILSEDISKPYRDELVRLALGP
ncbi:TetR/AcrR family transcriptional regulator [Jiella sp. M17.18]|uniref:TetR/AcrR family transcriptional regulator n=1 Tax=Jiella sp. M17.18 TaxID=3234247 RepID=UPI0034DF2AAE